MRKIQKYLSIIVSFILVFGSLAPVLVLTAQAQQVYIPSWIKQNAEWWAKGQIGDESFVEGLQYLIKEDILQIPKIKTETNTSQVIPSWIKQSAEWWAAGQISDDSFVNGIQWLIKNGIMKIDSKPPTQPEPQPEILQVPWTLVNLQKSYQNTAEYRAYQVSGDPFRIVCMEPCTIDEQLIFAKYQGFKNVHDDLIEFMGVDVLPELAPVDIHLNEDPFCTYVPGVSTGLAGVAGPSGKGRICIWNVEKEENGNRYYEFTPEELIKVRDQRLLVHEYAHVILFKRIPFSWEDIVNVASAYVVGNFVGELLRDPCRDSLNFRDQGKLVYELCQQNGLTFDDLTQSIIKMDELYHQGLGNEEWEGILGHMTIYQFKSVLNEILESDTHQAFMDIGTPPYWIGEKTVIGPNGGSFSLMENYVTLDIPSGAVTTELEITVDFNQNHGPHSIFFEPYGLEFAIPVQLTMKYEPDNLTPYGPEESLKILQLSKRESPYLDWVKIEDSTINLEDKTITATITKLGSFAIRGS